MTAPRLVPALAAALALALAAPASTAASRKVAIAGLETNAAENPLGIDDPAPRFSWRLTSNARGVRQRGFRVLVATSPERLEEGQADVWDSGESGLSDPFVIYTGPPLAPRTRYHWTVRAETTAGDTGWAAPAWFETAMLDPAEWTAAWIAGPERRLTRLTPGEGAADDAAIRKAGEFCRPVGWPKAGFFPSRVPSPEGECREIRPAPLLRTAFSLDKPVARARLYAAGLGYLDLSLNGEPVSDAVLDPALTDYSRTVFYTTHDVTTRLRAGENVIAAELGSGHFDSSTRTWDWGWDEAEWRATPRLRLELHIVHTDGSTRVVASGDAWRVSVDGPRRYDSYYLGETYDARRAIARWTLPAFDASAWPRARLVDAPAGRLRAQPHEPIRVVATRPAHEPSQPVPGVFVHDTGQNLAGWARIRVRAPRGTAIELVYSEKLRPDGLVSDEVGYALVGGQLQTDYYVAAGGGEEVWAPRFTYKGFRYLQIGAPGGRPLPRGVSVRVEHIEQVRTALRATSSFESTDALLNRIHRNTRWAVESNLHGVVTDTPIYEKNPWTGDAQLSSGVIATLFDAERFYRKLAIDMADAQAETGEVPLLAPSNEHYGYVGKPAFKPVDCCGATPAWDAFWFVLPWEAYRHYGDRRILEETFPLMQRYLDDWIPRWTSRDGDRFAHTLTAGLGDWDPPEGTPTNIALSSTAYYARMAAIARDAAQALGRGSDAERYARLAAAIRADFNARFLGADGIYRNAPDDPFTQTAQVLPLAFGIAPEEARERLLARIAADIRERGGNARVGILGARYLLPLLAEHGYADLAYTVATQTDYPGWGYWIEELGWTSLGEHWEATSRSRNHHFFGTILHWLYEELAGVRALDPGYARIEFRPEMPASLERAAMSYDTVRGTVAGGWRRTSTGLELEVVVPPNATGLVYVPAFSRESVVEDAAGPGVPADRAIGVRFLRAEGDRQVYEVGSGKYRFRVNR